MAKAGDEVTRARFEARCAAVFGPDWRSKVLVGPCGSFPLRDLPEEVGFPADVQPSSASGLWQTMPPRRWNEREGKA